MRFGKNWINSAVLRFKPWNFFLLIPGKLLSSTQMITKFKHIIK